MKKHEFNPEGNEEAFKMAAMGQRIRAAHAQAKPIGDKMIDAVRGAIWEAWEQGRDVNTGSAYPSVPLLDCLTQDSPEPGS
jgi:hypothetical protein